MNDKQYLITAYVVALGLILGSFLILHLRSQKVLRRKGREG
jgi:hypothetical protein